MSSICAYCLCVFVYVYIYVYVCMCICICVYVYVCVCACVRPAHRENSEKVVDGQLGLQPLLKHADGLVLQVVVGGDASVGQRLDGASVLRQTHKTGSP